ncbi:MAG: hypothetical protein IJ125_00985 [Atopobiaceae bacterium]|nr:hypothetical protein [Atopobiaceae bacterium]
MIRNSCATLRSEGRYTKFEYGGRTITFMHGNDLIQYLSVKEWDEGYLVVECLGKQKGIYEEYIDLTYILENLYMNPSEYLRGVEEVVIADVNRGN